MTQPTPHFTKHIPAQQKLAAALLRQAGQLRLTWAERQAPPQEASISKTDGTTIEASIECHGPFNVGDRLLATDQSWAIVTAAEEPALKLSGDINALLQAAHTLGEHHEPAMLAENGLWVLDNGISRDLATALTLTITTGTIAFTPIVVYLPEHHHCDHDHHHHTDDCDHGHSHGHEHGPGCDHQH